MFYPVRSEGSQFHLESQFRIFFKTINCFVTTLNSARDKVLLANTKRDVDHLFSLYRPLLIVSRIKSQ